MRLDSEKGIRPTNPRERVLIASHSGLRIGIDLPAGDSDRLLGNSTADAWIEASTSRCCALGNDRLAIITQLHGETVYFDSETQILGGGSVQLDLGARYALRSGDRSVTSALVEDVFDNAITDIALQISWVASPVGLQ